MRMVRRGVVCLSVLLCATAVAEDGAIQRDGFQLHYRTEGRGRPVVLLSGGPGIEVGYMKGAAAAMAGDFQYVYLEQRGTGRSRPAKLTPENMKLRLMVEDLEALRHNLQVDRLFLVGHSWGGMLAMAYAAEYPQYVDRLILISSGGPTAEFQSWFGDNIESRLLPEEIAARTYWVQSAKRGVDADKVMMEVQRAITPAYFFERAKGLAFAAELQDGMMHADALSLLGADLRKGYDSRPGLRKLDRPVLIVQGYQDPIGQKTAEDIHAVIASSTLRYLARCGHFPWLEQPEAFRKVLAEFLAKSAN